MKMTNLSEIQINKWFDLFEIFFWEVLFWVLSGYLNL